MRIVGPRHATRATSPNDAALVVLARAGTVLVPAARRRRVAGPARRRPGRGGRPRGLASRLGRPAAPAPPRTRAPAPRRDLGRGRQRLWPPLAGDARGARPGRRARAPHRPRGRHLARVRARRMTRVRSRSMSAAPLDPVYLIGGSDRPKVELAIRRLRARVRAEDGSIEEFTARRQDDDGEGMSGEDAAGACNALGLFGGTRLIVVLGAEVWGDDKKGLADVEALAAYLPAPAPDAVLALLTAGEVPAGAPAHARRGRRQRARVRPARQGGPARVAAQAGRARRRRSRRQRAHAPAGARPATTRRPWRARSRSSACGRAARRSPPSASTSCAC